MSGSSKGDHAMGPVAILILEECLSLLARGGMAAARAAHSKLAALHAAASDPKSAAAKEIEPQKKWDLPHKATSDKA